MVDPDSSHRPAPPRQTLPDLAESSHLFRPARTTSNASSMSAPDPDLSSLVFPSASRSIGTFLRTAARSKLSLRSRLHSIAADASFVSYVAAATALPLVANERCGSWYVSPAAKQLGVYFKSTDGHHGQWAFSLRRLNLPLLGLVAVHGGAVLVDSTRRGKSVPDALAKTVPAWAEVWNRLLFPGRTQARFAPAMVGASEAQQIEARIGTWVEELRALEVAGHVELDRPLRPIWVTQTTVHLLEEELSEARRLDSYPLVLCTASGSDSKAVAHDGYDYVQGAADDEEAWALELQPATFWANKDVLLNCDEDNLPGLIAELVGEQEGSEVEQTPILLKPMSTVFIARDAHCLQASVWDMVIDLRQAQAAPQGPNSDSQPRQTSRTVATPLEPGKLGSRTLRKVLPDILESLRTVFARSPDSKVLIIGDTFKDHSIGVALALICLIADDRGQMLTKPHQAGITKDYIKKRLGWIMVCIPDANPSRATLQSVNSVLMG